MSYLVRATRLLLLVLLVGPLALALAGCGAPSEVPQEEPVVHLKALALFYGRYVGSHRGQSPPSEEEFKKYIQSLPKSELETLGVTDVDSLFVSPRDGQPYHVQYNIPLPPPGPDGAPVVAYEQTGQGGERYVATSLGDVQLMDEEQFQKAAPQ